MRRFHPPLGVVPAFAVNVALNGAVAELAGAASAVDQVSVHASGDYTATTYATGGAAGGASAAPSFAIQVTDNEATARITAGGSVTAAASVGVTAALLKDTSSHAVGAAAGTWVALGLALALNIGLDTAEAAADGSATASGAITIGPLARPATARWITALVGAIPLAVAIHRRPAHVGISPAHFGSWAIGTAALASFHAGSAAGTEGRSIEAASVAHTALVALDSLSTFASQLAHLASQRANFAKQLVAGDGPCPAELVL